MLRKLTQKQTHQYWAWLIWGIAALSVPYQFILQSSTSVMIPMLMKQFNVTETGIGFLTSSYFYAYLLLQVPGGMLIDRFGARIVLFFSMLLISITCFMFAHAQTLMSAEISRLLMGAVTAPCVAGALYIAANWFPLNRFAILVGLTEMLAALGAALGQSGLAVAVTHIGWREALTLCAIIGALLTGLTFLIVRNRPNQQQRQSLRVEPSLAGRANNNVFKNFMAALRNPQIWLLGLFGGLSFAFIAAFAGLWAVPTLQGIYGVNLEVAAMGSSMIFLGTAIGAPILGWLADRTRQRRLIMFIVTSINLLLALTFVAVPLPLWLVFIVLMMMGFLASVYVLAFAMVREITDTNVRGSAMGFTNMMAILIGAPLLQPLIGFILKRHEHGAAIDITQLPPIAYQHALTSLLASLALALLVVLCLSRNE